MQRYMNPLLASIYTDARQTMQRLRELQTAEKKSDFAKYLKFQIEMTMDNYDFLLKMTNKSVIEVCPQTE